MRFSQSMHLLCNVFVFGDLDVRHKDWLTFSSGADIPEKLCYNYDFRAVTISNGLTQMVNFLTRIPDWESHNHALLDLFLSSDATCYSTMDSPPLGNSDRVFLSVSIDFPTNLKPNLVVLDRILIFIPTVNVW